MNHIKLAISTLVLFLAASVLSAQPSKDDKTLNDVYDTFLQREFAGPIPLANHQMERKAVRSPSLRLRFGRRSDPDMAKFEEKRFFQEVNQKPIRSPSLRLRFGRRSDPMMPVRPDEYEYENFEDELNAQRDDFVKRVPSVRLRWGRSSFPEPNELIENDWEVSEAEKRAPRLRWGRSGYPTVLIDDLVDKLKEKRRPSERLRWGRSAGITENVITEDSVSQNTEPSEITVLEDTVAN